MIKVDGNTERCNVEISGDTESIVSELCMAVVSVASEVLQVSPIELSQFIADAIKDAGVPEPTQVIHLENAVGSV